MSVLYRTRHGCFDLEFLKVLVDLQSSSSTSVVRLGPHKSVDSDPQAGFLSGGGSEAGAVLLDQCL